MSNDEFIPPCKLINVSPRVWWYGKLYEEDGQHFKICPICSCNSITDKVKWYTRWRRKRQGIENIEELRCSKCKTRFLVISNTCNSKGTWIWCRYGT
jgi:hypothetical protein